MTIKMLGHLALFFYIFSQVDSASNRIIGGSVASEGQLPYQAGLIIDGTKFCGAAIISPDYVLTAAHCIHTAKNIEVHLGTEQIFNPNEPGHVIVMTNEKIIHENFELAKYRFDIALIKLPSPIINEPNIIPLALPTWSQNVSYEGERARSSGWGNIDDTIPELSADLRFVDFDLISTAECQETYGADTINECHVCASSKNGKVGFCSGDTGGPLAFLNGGSLQFLAGIASFGNPFACESPSPLAFVKVACYLDWIYFHTGIIIEH